jgi:DNA-binding HxlR family transcriptional regulator
MARTRKNVSCPVEITLKVISGRWKVMIIRQLLEDKKRFNHLQRELAGITHRTLTRQLREMESSGLILRHDHNETPPRVEYRLSPLGLTLKPILMEMETWAQKYGHRV